MTTGTGRGMEEEWFYCLDHRTVEPVDGCRAAVRIGPFPTREEAAKALGIVAASQPGMGQRPRVVRGLIRGLTDPESAMPGGPLRISPLDGDCPARLTTANTVHGVGRGRNAARGLSPHNRHPSRADPCRDPVRAGHRRGRLHPLLGRRGDSDGHRGRARPGPARPDRHPPRVRRRLRVHRQGGPGVRRDGGSHPVRASSPGQYDRGQSAPDRAGLADGDPDRNLAGQEDPNASRGCGGDHRDRDQPLPVPVGGHRLSHHRLGLRADSLPQGHSLPLRRGRC